MTSPEPDEIAPAELMETEAAPSEKPEKVRLDPTRYGDWELNGKCVDF